MERTTAMKTSLWVLVGLLVATVPAKAGEPAAPAAVLPASDSGVETPSPLGGPTVAAPAADDSSSQSAAQGETPAEAEGSRPKEGLRGVLKLFTGASKVVEPGGQVVEKEVTDETQRRVNELARLATTNSERNRVDEAIKNINELIAIKPYDSNYHFALGLCFRRQGKFKDALKKYQDVLDLGGPKALVAILRAEAYASENDRDKVLQFLKEAGQGGRNIIQDVGVLPALTPYQQDTEFVKLALQLEKFGLSRSKGSDPFTNPFPKIDRRGGRGEEGATPEVETQLTAEDQEKLLLEARKTYERVKFYIKLEDEAKAMKAYAALRDMAGKKDLILIPKISNDFRMLLAQLETLEVEIEGIRLKYYYGQAQEKLRQMKDLFTDGEYRRLEAVHSEVTKLTQEMQQANKSYKPVADQILEASGRWYNRAQVRKEFETRKPVIQGIVIAADGKLALLNNRLVKQGEDLDDMRVVKVETNKVTFRFKGEDIPLLFRRY